MRNKVYPILALAALLCFSTTLVAQDVEAPEMPQTTKAAKAGKKARGGKAKHAAIMSAFGSAELTDSQKSQLSGLVSAKKEEMSAIHNAMTELVSKEDAKSIKASVRKAMRSGTDKAAAHKAALEEIGLSAEDQAKVAQLQRQRETIEQEIVSAVVATFSEEQKEAMKIPKKGKGKKGKKKKKADDQASVLTGFPVLA